MVVILSSLGFLYRKGIAVFARRVISHLNVTSQETVSYSSSSTPIASTVSQNSSPQSYEAPKPVVTDDAELPEPPAAPASLRFHRDNPSAADMTVTKEGDNWRITIVAATIAADPAEAGADCHIQAVGRLSGEHLVARPVSRIIRGTSAEVGEEHPNYYYADDTDMVFAIGLIKHPRSAGARHETFHYCSSSCNPTL